MLLFKTGHLGTYHTDDNDGIFRTECVYLWRILEKAAYYLICFREGMRRLTKRSFGSIINEIAKTRASEEVL